MNGKHETRWTSNAGIRIATLAVVLAIASPGLRPNALAAEDCRSAVEAAFLKQRQQKAFRFAAEMPGEGGVTRMTIDYVLPDRMHQKVEAPGQPAPVETIAIARWAWGTQGGGWEELQPQFAQSITAHVHDALVAPPKLTGGFACLGKSNRDGAEVLGYRSLPEAGAEAAPAGQPELARTIYVDAASGLPVANVVAAIKDGTPPVFDGRYSYSGDIKVEAPIGEPK
ncbi:MAG: hypothetical protein ACK4MF_07545 [Hyphomicrobiaceae bacterium]